MIDLTLHRPELEGGPFEYAGNEIGILLLHGLTATTAEVRVLADSLKTMGWTIAAPLLPGHGTSLLDLEKCRWQDWADHAKDSYHDLRQKCSRVVVGGESMGGLLATYLAIQYPEISGLLLYAPAFSAHRLWLTPVAQYWIRFKSKPNLNDGLPWKGYKYHSTRAGVQLLKLQKVVKKEVGNIRMPVAMFLGSQDHTISLTNALSVYNQLPTREKLFHIYGNSSHCLILDHQADLIARDTIQFIQNTIIQKTE